MDAYERQAKSMEHAQDRRLMKCDLQQKILFWTKVECETYDTIRLLRQKSKTYQPQN